MRHQHPHREERGYSRRSPNWPHKLAAAIMVTAMSLVLACGSESAGSQRTLIPEDAVVIADFNVSGVLNSPLPLMSMIVQFTGSSTGDSVDRAIGRFYEDTGVDLRLISHAEMFMDAGSILGTVTGFEGSSADERKVGAAFYGEFDKDVVLSNTGNDYESGYEVSQYQGYDLYSFIGDFMDSITIAFVDNDVVLVGTDLGTKAMLDVASGATSAASGELSQTLDSLGDRHIGIAVETPQEILDETSELANGGIAMPSLALMPAMTAPHSVMRLLLKDDSLHIEAASYFDDSDSAGAAKEAYEGTVAMVGMASDSPDLQELVSAVEISQSDKTATLSLTIDSSMMDRIYEDMRMDEGYTEPPTVTPLPQN